MWENDVIADCHNVDDLEEASRTIVQMLSVRTWVCCCDF
jgi:hypothetical protein